MVKKSRSKKSGGSKNTALTITLWVLFALSIAGLIVSIVIQCKGENFVNNYEDDVYTEWEKQNRLKFVSDKPQPPIRKDPGNGNKRCGNIDSCQNLARFPKNVRDDYKLGSLYPVYPTERKKCNPVSDAWIHYASREDVENLTVSKDGRRYICDRSCPQVVSACGLNDSGLSDGVM